MFDDFGDLQLSVLCVSSKKNTCCIMGAIGVLGLRGYWKVELITLTDHALNLCLVSKRNDVK